MRSETEIRKAIVELDQAMKDKQYNEEQKIALARGKEMLLWVINK